MKSIIFIAFLAVFSSVGAVTWTSEHEQAIEKSTLALGKNLPSQTAIIGRTGRPETRVGVVISNEGHLLAPYLRSIDGEDTPYLLYRKDGSRLKLTTIVERPKRFVALLKIEDQDLQKTPVRISNVVDHTVAIPTCAPIASLGEPAGIYVEHLEFPPPEDATVFRLDSIFHNPGTPVLDLSGSLVGITLKPRDSNTPALMLSKLIGEIAELDSILPDVTESDLPNLPLAPEATSEEIKELTESPLCSARERYIQSTHPSPKPCVIIFNEGSQATHSVIGTIVRQDGLILTKASELGSNLRVRYGGRNYPGVLLSTDEETDLALVGIEASGLPVVRWTDSVPQPGATLASPILLQETTEDMVSEPTSYAGIYSHVLAKNTPSIQASSRVTSLGIVTEQLSSNVTIASIKSETPAFESGLSPGDVIKSLNDRPVNRRADLTSLLDDRKVGDKVTVKIERGGERMDFEVELISPVIIPPATGIDIQKGIPMIPSVRRGPFPNVMVHTTPLNAWDCGSPVFDLKGRALGLNIAAVSANRTVALLPKDVREALTRLMAETRSF